jgi:hypothetical protein
MNSYDKSLMCSGREEEVMRLTLFVAKTGFGERPNDEHLQLSRGLDGVDGG